MKEFRDFIMRPNLIDVAVAFVMGGALAALVTSLVENVVMPIVGIIFGEPSFDDVLIATVNDSQIRFGSFLTALVTFIMVGFAVFYFIVKPYKAVQARMEEPAEEEAPAGPSETELLTEIRDALQRQ